MPDFLFLPDKFLKPVPMPEGAGPQMPDEIKEMMGRSMLMHNVKEFTHLAEILPDLYNEFKDNFTVGLK